MEDQNIMVKQIQKETVKDLKHFKDQNKEDQKNVNKKFEELKKENINLMMKLENKDKANETLQNELNEVLLKMENKEIQLKAALGKNAVDENESIFLQSISTTKQKSLINFIKSKNLPLKRCSQGIL